MMARNLYRGWTGLLVATFFLFTAVTLLWVASPATSGNSAKSAVEWNERASNELAAEFHRMHQAWNKGDVNAVKQLIAGDNVLVTFELGVDGHTPVPLRSKQEIDAFFDKIVKDTGAQHEAFVLDMPKMNCRATDTFGVCTEECTVHLKMSDQTERIDKYFGTSVAVKYEDGWKFIQYHMSVGGPSQVYKDGKPLQ